jgi:hypothetical protein
MEAAIKITIAYANRFSLRIASYYRWRAGASELISSYLPDHSNTLRTAVVCEP